MFVTQIHVKMEDSVLTKMVRLFAIALPHLVDQDVKQEILVLQTRTNYLNK